MDFDEQAADTSVDLGPEKRCKIEQLVPGMVAKCALKGETRFSEGSAAAIPSPMRSICSAGMPLALSVRAQRSMRVRGGCIEVLLAHGDGEIAAGRQAVTVAFDLDRGNGACKTRGQLHAIQLELEVFAALRAGNSAVNARTEAKIAQLREGAIACSKGQVGDGIESRFKTAARVGQS